MSAVTSSTPASSSDNQEPAAVQTSAEASAQASTTASGNALTNANPASGQSFAVQAGK